jgi:hypothetical protein
MCVSALRGIDAQRSSFDMKHSARNGYEFFSAVAWNSKSRQSMPWACPTVLFGSHDAWLSPLLHVWGSHDFMFPNIERGRALADSAQMGDEPASNYMILRYLREILALPELAMSEEMRKRLRRHSFRHFIANSVRVLSNVQKFTPSDSFQAGRWKEGGTMPLRYAQETQFLLAVDIILRVVDECSGALQRVPLHEWPLFGGWELLLPERASARQPIQLFSPEPEEAEGRDSSDEDEPKPTATHPTEVRAGIPEGWSCVRQILSSGREVPHYYGPDGVHVRSRLASWREFDKAPSIEPTEVCEEVEAPRNACGIPGCLVPGAVGSGHAGPHVFPEPTHKRHRPTYVVF